MDAQKDDNGSGEVGGWTGRTRPACAKDQRWKRTAMYVVGAAVIAGAAVAVTLAATRSEAQRQNLIAYLRGQVDGLKQGGFLDGWTAAERWYAELDLEELVEVLAQEQSFF